MLWKILTPKLWVFLKKNNNNQGSQIHLFQEEITSDGNSSTENDGVLLCCHSSMTVMKKLVALFTLKGWNTILESHERKKHLVISIDYNEELGDDSIIMNWDS